MTWLRSLSLSLSLFLSFPHFFFLRGVSGGGEFVVQAVNARSDRFPSRIINASLSLGSLVYPIITSSRIAHLPKLSSCTVCKWILSLVYTRIINILIVALAGSYFIILLIYLFIMRLSRFSFSQITLLLYLLLACITYSEGKSPSKIIGVFWMKITVRPGNFVAFS